MIHIGVDFVELRFDVSGMTCAACSARVEKVTSQVPGVEKVEVNLLAGKMVVRAKSDAVTEQIISAIRAAGYDASLPGRKKVQIHEVNQTMQQMKYRIIWSFVFLIFLMYFTMGHMIGIPVPNWYHDNPLVGTLIQLFLTLPVI